MKQLKPISFVLGILIISGVFAYTEQSNIIWVGNFSKQNLSEWKVKNFSGQTSYILTQLNNNMVLKSVSQNSCSGLVKKIRVDIKKYPFLNWRWRIENRLSGTFNERLKSGDDYAARIYVIVSGGFIFWNSKALNYVWAKNSPKGSSWPSAFAKNNAVMMALRSFEAPISVWQTEKQNIYEDFKTLFGKEIRFIDAVALMTDTDNTRKKATAHYGDIYFSTR